MAGHANRVVGDFLGRGLRMHLGICDEQVVFGLQDQAERPDRTVLGIRQDPADIFQVPQVLPEGTANHTFSFIEINHHGADRRGIGTHDGLGDVRSHATPRHKRQISFPVFIVAGSLLGIDDPEIAFRSNR